MGLDTQYVGELASSWVAGKLQSYLQEKHGRGVWPRDGIQFPLLWSLVCYPNKWKIPEHHLRASSGLGVVQLV